jgi:septal ring factor EnvC (AmiA/AmiB activator)
MRLVQLLQQVSNLELQCRRLRVENEELLRESRDSIAAVESQIDTERTINDNLRVELSLKAPHIEDMEMEIKELKRGQKHDREQIERSDTFISKLQGQIGTQQMRIDGLQEVRSIILPKAMRAVGERDLDSPGCMHNLAAAHRRTRPGSDT